MTRERDRDGYRDTGKIDREIEGRDRKPKKNK